ncbi:MAG: hypothetical protein JWO38_7475 [Gemmataceae bacterium]|nr:hypothetical protein [Gemmataceae bacterium]
MHPWEMTGLTRVRLTGRPVPPVSLTRFRARRNRCAGGPRTGTGRKFLTAGIASILTLYTLPISRRPPHSCSRYHVPFRHVGRLALPHHRCPVFAAEGEVLRHRHPDPAGTT